MSKIQFNMTDKGYIAIQCSFCGKPLKKPSEFTEQERQAFRGEIYMPPQSCKSLNIPCIKYENTKHRIE